MLEKEKEEDLPQSCYHQRCTPHTIAWVLQDKDHKIP